MNSSLVPARAAVLLGIALIALSVTLFSNLPTDLAQAAMRPWSLAKISDRAEHIIVGNVKKLSPGYYAEWPGGNAIVFTDVTLEVQQLWKGKWTKSEITLQVPGGKLPDGKVMHASEAPQFRKGEKVLVFTKKYNGTHWVCGWAQGKYHVVKSRVEGQTGFPIEKDVLLHALKRRITDHLAQSRKKQRQEGSK